MTEFTFLQAFDKDIQSSLLSQLRDLWSHSSTAIEGNSLSLAETKVVLEEGITNADRPLKDHQNVIGHARAIDILYGLIEKEITEQDLFNLHQTILCETTSGSDTPQQAWKNQSNNTYTVDSKGNQIFIEYASPDDVAELMQEWLAELKLISKPKLTLDEAIAAYCQLHMGLVHIHPLLDGNGLLARLLSNVPLLKSGYAPLVISQDDKQEYIQLLAFYQIDSGVITTNTGVWPETKSHGEFEFFCMRSYAPTLELVDRAEIQQEKIAHR